MAHAKITGGEYVKVAKLTYDRKNNRGTKNLAQHNAFKKLDKLKHDWDDGNITEEEFAEQQSDILSDFVDKWGDPVPPSTETAEQKAERKARKARKKAVDEKNQMKLIAENGFVEGYTIIFNGTLPKEESDRIKALDNPTEEFYNKIYKPFKEGHQYRYRKQFGVELRLLAVLEEGEDGLLHMHSMINTPFRVIENNDKTNQFIAWTEHQWERYSGAKVNKTIVGYKIEGVWCFAPYTAKNFFDRVPRKKGKHYYWITDNLRRCLETEERDIPDDKMRCVISKLRSSNDEAVAYIESTAEMENRRVLEIYFHDSKDRIDDTTYIELTISNVTRDIEEGRLGKKRSTTDVTVWEDSIPLFSHIEHFSEDIKPTEPMYPIKKLEWHKDSGWVRYNYDDNDTVPSANKIQQCNCVNAPLITIPQQREIMSNGLSWIESLPQPQEGRRIVISNCLVFDELAIF